MVRLYITRRNPIVVMKALTVSKVRVFWNSFRNALIVVPIAAATMRLNPIDRKIMSLRWVRL